MNSGNTLVMIRQKHGTEERQIAVGFLEGELSSAGERKNQGSKDGLLALR
jgi:hypothetical protein